MVTCLTMSQCYARVFHQPLPEIVKQKIDHHLRGTFERYSHDPTFLALLQE
jgi:hypothetical protein